MTLRDEILTGGFNLTNRDDGAIATALSTERVKLAPTEIGNGGILEAIGMADGNILLDVINSAPDFRHVKSLLEQGRLRIDSALVRATLDSLVPAVLTSDQATKLKALAEVPDPVSAQQVAQALEGM